MTFDGATEDSVVLEEAAARGTDPALDPVFCVTVVGSLTFASAQLAVLATSLAGLDIGPRGPRPFAGDIRFVVVLLVALAVCVGLRTLVSRPDRWRASLMAVGLGLVVAAVAVPLLRPLVHLAQLTGVRIDAFLAFGVLSVVWALALRRSHADFSSNRTYLVHAAGGALGVRLVASLALSGSAPANLMGFGAMTFGLDLLPLAAAVLGGAAGLATALLPVRR